MCAFQFRPNPISFINVCVRTSKCWANAPESSRRQTSPQRQPTFWRLCGELATDPSYSSWQPVRLTANLNVVFVVRLNIQNRYVLPASIYAFVRWFSYWRAHRARLTSARMHRIARLTMSGYCVRFPQHSYDLIVRDAHQKQRNPTTGDNCVWVVAASISFKNQLVRWQCRAQWRNICCLLKSLVFWLWVMRLRHANEFWVLGSERLCSHAILCMEPVYRGL